MCWSQAWLRTLNLGLDIVNGIRALDLESDGLARDCGFVSCYVLRGDCDSDGEMGGDRGGDGGAKPVMVVTITYGS